MHEPVLVEEVIRELHIIKGEKYIDATVGAGGHSSEIVKRGGEVLGLDQDDSMLEVAQSKLELANPNFKLINANFKDIGQIATNSGFDQVNGILFDLGISNLHYLDTTRGFSFNNPLAALDMRLSPTVQAVKASDLINTLPKEALKQVFTRSMETWQVNKLVNNILFTRVKKAFVSVGDFLQVCEFLHTKSGKHPATNAFLALRMAVNSEMETIEAALPQAMSLLKEDGRLLVITFHSLEDSIVKKLFVEFEKQNLGEIVTKKAIAPSEEEINKNPKARSARLRVIKKII